MFAYQLLPRLEYLSLAGKNEDGELEWVGTVQAWNKVTHHESLYE